MNKDNHHNDQTDSTQRRRFLRLRPWRSIGWGRRIWRVFWMTGVGLWLLSILQVLLGIVFNPPLTPLMVQRFRQQLFSSERPVRFERDYVSIDDISSNLVSAVVYSEDGLFMYHHGFDVKQMKQAYRENQQAEKRVRQGSKKPPRMRGGSTISQQTAKNAFLPHSRNMLRKAVEAYYTILIEKFWGKERIMEVYLNVIEFGDGIYGAEAASQHYFGHSAKTLSRREAAQLAATLPSPLKRNPALSSPYFRRRTNDILSRFSWGKISLDKKAGKRNKKYENQETLWDFVKWLWKNK